MIKIAYTDFYNEHWVQFKRHLCQVIEKAKEMEDHSIESGLTDLIGRVHGFEATESWRYGIKEKQVLDKVVMREIIKFEISGQGLPTKINVSPKMYEKLNRIFPHQYESVIMFDNLPVIEDKTLIDEQIVIQ